MGSDSTGRDVGPTTGTMPGSTGAPGSTSSVGTTDAATTDASTTEASTTGVATTSGPAGALLLYPLTCTEADWQAGPARLECMSSEVGPFVERYANYTLGGQDFERVIEVRPPPNIAIAPVDGIYTIDTSDFSNAQFRSRTACVEGDCRLDFLITSERDGTVLSDWGGGVVGGDEIVEVVLNLPSEPGLVIHLNVNAPEVGGDNRFLWIDPRVVEAGP